MSTPCTLCQSSKDLPFEEIVIAFGLKGRKNESKNCCEPAGYICSNLDKILVEARNKREYKRRVEKKKTEKMKAAPTSVPTIGPDQGPDEDPPPKKVLRKRKLVINV